MAEEKRRWVLWCHKWHRGCYEIVTRSPKPFHPAWVDPIPVMPVEEHEELRQAADVFLNCSQGIERKGEEGPMEEYEDAWHELQALLDSTGGQHE